MNQNDIEVRITADGSTTLYRKDIDETYHSHHGALQEARHVFIKEGLCKKLDLTQIKILEVGLGTGLNALLTYLFALDNGLTIEYHGLEAFPLDAEILNQVNYNQIIPDSRTTEAFKLLHSHAWNQKFQWAPNFEMLKIHDALQTFECEKECYDLIYFDAFGPRAQEEMWDFCNLEKLYQALKSNGILVTYCAKGSFKRNLKALGFVLENVPGPPGKREMTRAIK
jgi:tRNA U34 5-methylaminomethyl-2-thiouridine-forming methyltransferase MnmC